MFLRKITIFASGILLLSLPFSSLLAMDHTFIVWIHGDSDNRVMTSSAPQTRAKLYSADQADHVKVEIAAKNCPACNVLIFHDYFLQKKGLWRTPVAAELTVFGHGHQIEKTSFKSINSADPRVLTSILTKAEALFPDSTLHLVYRGHSFLEPYAPGHNDVPFSYTHPEAPYNTGVFVKSLADAKLSRPLGTVTFAGCEMAEFHFAQALSSYADYFIANEIEQVEILNVGFDFSFINAVHLDESPKALAWLISTVLLSPFEKTESVANAMLSAEVSLVDLHQLAHLNEIWTQLCSLQELNFQQYMASAKIVKTVSDRYISYLQQKGKSSEYIQKLIPWLEIPSTDDALVDMVNFFHTISAHTKDAELQSLFEKFNEYYLDTVWVLNKPKNSRLNGLSLRLNLINSKK